MFIFKRWFGTATPEKKQTNTFLSQKEQQQQQQYAIDKERLIQEKGIGFLR